MSNDWDRRDTEDIVKQIVVGVAVALLVKLGEMVIEAYKRDRAEVRSEEK